jgi:hypothetical protein
MNIILKNVVGKSYVPRNNSCTVRRFEKYIKFDFGLRISAGSYNKLKRNLLFPEL